MISVDLCLIVAGRRRESGHYRQKVRQNRRGWVRDTSPFLCLVASKCVFVLCDCVPHLELAINKECLSTKKLYPSASFLVPGREEKALALEAGD